MIGDLYDRRVYEKRTLYNNLHGKTPTGFGVAMRYIDLGRQMGKTSQMLDSLSDGAIVFCANQTIKQLVEDHIRYNSLKVRVEVAKNLAAVREKLVGTHYQPDEVFVDNGIFDAELMRIINDFYQKD